MGSTARFEHFIQTLVTGTDSEASILSEWKVDKDSRTDLHRHLSHLVGLYPSYSIASYPEDGATAVMGITRKALLDAAEKSLRARGDGKGPDADAGE